MVEIRQQIIVMAGPALMKALQIAVRYSVCRRQFANVPGSEKERKILDYQTQMFKLGPLVANAFVMQIVGKELMAMQNIMKQQLKQGVFEMMDVMHHLTSGLKSIYSTMTYDGIDQSRQACGGAGYSVYSGFPQIMSEYSPVPTFEGENSVMAVQSSRFLQKLVK